MLFFIQLAIQQDEKPVFKRYCVYKNPLLNVVPDCNVLEFSPEIAAFINASLEMNKTGWSFFASNSNPDLTPKEQMRAVGYAEGAIFTDQIFNHRSNIHDYFLKNYFGEAKDFPAELYQFFADNIVWMRKQVRLNRDSYWKQIAYQLAHFDGLVQGYQQKCSDSQFLSELDFMIFMSSGDLLDVVKFALPDARPHLNTPEIDEINDHCSGLVRITGDDIFLSQTAWFTYGAMTRVSKEFTFNLGANARVVKFSSYPGFSYSFDDWYSMDSGFMLFETTDSVFNDDFYDLCSVKSLMTWIRAPVAARLAKDAEHFATLISKYNSGTYNNQWVMVDLKKFDAGAAEDMIWVTEQIPGKASSVDATESTLRRGYFPSHNLPSMFEVWQVSGYPAQSLKNFTKNFADSPRAKMFQRDAPKVDSIEKMKKIMRQNDYLHDPLSKDVNGNIDAGLAISARYDLRTDHTVKAYGGFDNKIGSYNRKTKAFKSHFISGPTNDDVPSWKFLDNLWCPRLGLPDGPYEHEWVEEDMVLRK